MRRQPGSGDVRFAEEADIGAISPSSTKSFMVNVRIPMNSRYCAAIVASSVCRVGRGTAQHPRRNGRFSGDEGASQLTRQCSPSTLTQSICARGAAAG
jgi:hypothetical protein